MFEFVDVGYKNIVQIPHLWVHSDRITSLIGPSGSGKTTILRMMNKLISPTRGFIRYKEKELQGIDTVLHRREVAMLTQTPIAFEGNLRDNLNMALRFQEKADALDSKLLDILEQIQVDKDLDTPVTGLSGGEKQRLALGRLLVADPLVYLLDEPASALDEETGEVIMTILEQQVQKKGKTIVMVTHSKEMAWKYSDTIIQVEKGLIVRRIENERNH